MTEALTISATSKLEAVEPTIGETLANLQDRLNALPVAEMVAVVEGVTRALAPESKQKSTVVAALAGEQRFSPEERMEAAVNILRRSFERRHELLDGALSTSQVAALLGTSRQTPHDRVESESLLAAMDRGGLRFPPWQFDPEGEDGVVWGLPSVIRALEVSPIAKMSWLTRPNPMLGSATPLAWLKTGNVEDVVSLARGVGTG